MLHLLPTIWILCKVIGRFMNSPSYASVLANLDVKASLSVICPVALLSYLRVSLCACLRYFLDLCNICSNFLRACSHCVIVLALHDAVIVTHIFVGVHRDCVLP